MNALVEESRKYAREGQSSRALLTVTESLMLAFQDGAKWQKERDAKLCESAFGSLTSDKAFRAEQQMAKRIREQS